MDRETNIGAGVSGTTRRTVLRGAAALGLVPAASGAVSAEEAESASSSHETWDVASPDGTNEAVVTLTDDGEVLFSIRRNGTEITGNSPLGLETAEEDFTSGLRYENHEVTTEQGSYTTTSGNRLEHTYDAEQLTIAFSTPDGAEIELDVRASAEGVAYRYRVPGDDIVEVTDEHSTFDVPDTDAWAMPFSNDFDVDGTQGGVVGDYYENTWERTTTQEMDGEYGWGSLFEIDDSNWLLLAEADVTEGYCTSRIVTESDGTTFETIFPVVGEDPDNTERITVSDDAPLETPWRVAVVGDLPDIAESDLITDLSQPAEFDGDWVRPGRSSWSWWSEWDVTSLANQKRYVDFAEKRGWEFHLVDVGWKENLGEDGVRELIDYAETVDIILWTDSADLTDASERQEQFSDWSDWGAAGVKVDYFDDDDRETMQFYIDILEDAADNGLTVNFHGCTIPKGWRRRWPNLMTKEAIKGAEYYKWDTFPVEHNAIVPFTRNVLGPMDYTPVTFSADGRNTTAGHELALSIVQESGQMHYADHPDVYEEWPAATRFLDTAAAAWETTRFLDGYPGEYAVVARQKPDSPLWHVGAIVDEERTIEVDCSFLESGTTYEYELTHDDGDDALAVETGTATSGDTLSKTVPDDGGLTILLYPEDETAPDAPSNLESPSVSGPTVELSWDGATDAETELAHYNVYLDGEKYDEWGSTHARLDLAGETTYEISVSAVDVAGNESGTSDAVTVTTGEEVTFEGTYWFENVNSGLAMEVDGGSEEAGANVHQWEYTESDHQQWQVVENDDGTYRLENVATGLVLAGDFGAALPTLVQEPWEGADSQRWDLVNESGSTFILVNRESNELADVLEMGTDNGDDIILWQNNGQDNQRWILHQIDEDDEDENEDDENDDDENDDDQENGDNEDDGEDEGDDNEDDENGTDKDNESDDSADQDDDDDGIPGFGIGTALTSLGGAAYLLKNRLSESPDRD